MDNYKFWIFLFIWWLITTAQWAIDFNTKDGVKVQVHTDKIEKIEKKDDGPKPSF